MYFVYVLKNKVSKELYYGYTADVHKRLSQHNKNGSWELLYYEAYKSEKDARARERKLKQYGQSRTHLKNRIQNSIQMK